MVLGERLGGPLGRTGRPSTTCHRAVASEGDSEAFEQDPREMAYFLSRKTMLIALGLLASFGAGAVFGSSIVPGIWMPGRTVDVGDEIDEAYRKFGAPSRDSRLESAAEPPSYRMTFRAYYVTSGSVQIHVQVRNGMISEVNLSSR